MGKFTGGNVGGLQKHNQRENKNYGNENVDLTKSNQNYDLQNHENINYRNRINKIIKENRVSDKAVRKDAIVYVDTIVGSDKEFFKKLSPGEQKRFFEQSYEYLKNKVGEKNVVAAVVHMDETKGVGGSPHMHFSFVPMNEDGTLSAKKKINRNFLREVQDEFPRHLKERGFDIERGMEKSTKKHLEPLEYKKEQIRNDIQKANRQQEEFKQKYAIMKDNIAKKCASIEKTSESLSKLEDHTKGVLGKLDKIEVKKGFLSDKLTISEQDYSILVNMAKVGESKVVENLQLKSKVGDLQQKLEKKGLDEHRRDIKLQQLEGIERKYIDLERQYKGLDKSFKRVEKAINDLDMVEPVNNQINAIKLAEKTISKSKSLGRSR